jgi:hypothetical protein
VNRDNNTGKPSGILISTENEQTLFPHEKPVIKHLNRDLTGNTSGYATRLRIAIRPDPEQHMDGAAHAEHVDFVGWLRFSEL